MRLACHSFRQKRLSGSRRTHQQRPFRAHSSDLLIFLRIVQEINNLCQKLLCFILACHVIKSNPRGRLHIHFCIALSELHKRVASAPASHLLHHLPCQKLSEPPEDQKRQDPA